MEVQKRRNRHVEKYWLDHYVKNGVCSLCNQSCFVETEFSLNFCICPNGQIMRILWTGKTAEEAKKGQTASRNVEP